MGIGPRPVDAVMIEQRIRTIRGQRVMLSGDLANLYGVSPKALVQAVKRNALRFPDDFMFRLSFEEARACSGTPPRLRSQIVTLKRGEHLKYAPYAFTEQGVAMLSSVLRSERAVVVNIAIMRAFVRLRGILSASDELASKVLDLEVRMGTNESSVLALLTAGRTSGAKRKRSRTRARTVRLQGHNL